MWRKLCARSGGVCAGTRQNGAGGNDQRSPCRMGYQFAHAAGDALVVRTCLGGAGFSLQEWRGWCCWLLRRGSR